MAIWDEENPETTAEAVDLIVTEALSRMTFRTSAEDRGRMFGYIEAKAGFDVANAIDAYVYDLMIDTAAIAGQLGFALAAAPVEKPYEECLERALKASGLEKRTSVLDLDLKPRHTSCKEA